MPKRPRSHEIEDLSRGRLREIFNKCGWVVWDLHPDYGEDLLVRIFIDGIATHYSFFVQAKSTDNIEKYMTKDGKQLRFPLHVKHLEHWKQFWEPVIITVWDAVSNITYWEVVQNYLDTTDIQTPSNSTKKSLLVRVPTSNILDQEGLNNLLAITKLRFERFELTCWGVDTIKEMLSKELDIEIEYHNGDDFVAYGYFDKKGGIRVEGFKKYVTEEMGKRIEEGKGPWPGEPLWEQTTAALDAVVQRLIKRLP